MTRISPLRTRTIEDMTICNLSPATQRSYLNAVRKFSTYFGKSPDLLGPEDVRTYQVHLVGKGVAWATLNQVVCALRFFYGVIPKTVNEFIRRFLQHVLPKGFRRIRHFGFFANGHRASKIARIRTLTGQVTDRHKPQGDAENNSGTYCHHRGEPTPCPCCGSVMRLVFEWRTMPRRAWWPDTS